MKKNWMKTHNKLFNQLDGVHRNYLNLIWEMGKTTIESTSLVSIYANKYYTICDNITAPYIISVEKTKVQKICIDELLK